ncbi:sigma-70 family RNA polymerase sigma factor [Paenibacillus bovis]|uniref:RNA polymerase subunit sigma-24 n=1 Tax=Paenibacillus bovis TaxID=1616788 RepID=A0A172ZDZ5_9BACL|nr:sigma-70 family RNA polymerase sigma factor [Paenibacillus bovis]ANF95881.1 RNA polymerase subunit sigma-24 [Paenibacillus bovis]
MDTPEPEQFKQIFYEHYPTVKRKLTALLRDQAIADDLAQEVFLRLYRNPPDNPEAIGAWLHRVLTRIAYDYMDKKARERRLQDKQEQYYDLEGHSPPTGEEIMIQQLEQDEVHLLLDQLPPRDRQALLMRYSGYSYAEIAEQLQLRPPLVGTLLHRATNKLRKKMLKST